LSRSFRIAWEVPGDDEDAVPEDPVPLAAVDAPVLAAVVDGVVEAVFAAVVVGVVEAVFAAVVEEVTDGVVAALTDGVVEAVLELAAGVEVVADVS
jgi:hypothetical protein